MSGHQFRVLVMPEIKSREILAWKKSLQYLIVSLLEVYRKMLLSTVWTRGLEMQLPRRDLLEQYFKMRISKQAIINAYLNCLILLVIDK